ncbi:hypothetical protein PYCCODRAFT_1465720 [Trametes coccinea BRFM310]|uniref:Jacalin-type lectin domain-containing protein n=1 Tax=Trametes coccinea (strain BRFM310) TaxID=1353009 RepID=A0A1Y2IVW8_TRAC3|nr:hypothetical protein PYCCODRAFT_1465720 [Trametes coccinea BRFM310]
MNSFSSSALFGGDDGVLSQDILFLNGDHQFVINDPKKGQLDLKHPIQKIVISCGWVVDGFAVTYQLADGSSTTKAHGSQFPKASDVVTFNQNERLVGVFGRAGPQSYYHRNMVNNIGFVIFDTETGTTRTAGPYGNGNRSNQGAPFYVSDVLAFGSIAKPDEPALGLCGVFFYTD